jgi:hypothetical protein
LVCPIRHPEGTGARRYPTGEATQVAYLLSGLSQKGLGDKAAAKAALDSGFQLDPSSDTAKLIDQQRNSL